MNSKQKTTSDTKSLQNIYTGAFSLLLFVGIAVCAICNMAISHAFTWSLYPISSIIFAWLVLIPTIRYGEKGILGSLIACTIFIAPFLYVLNSIIKTSSMFLPVGLSAAAVGAVYLWIIFFLFKGLKTRKFLAAAITVLLSVPVYMLFSFILSKLISEVFIDVWDVMDISIAVTAAIVLFIIDLIVQRRARIKNTESLH